MTEELHLAQIPLQYPEERQRLSAFLAGHRLTLEEDVCCAFGIFDLQQTLVACGCAAGGLLKCFAVEPRLRGQNALGMLVSALVQERFATGCYELLVMTRLENEALFLSCGFFPVVRTQTLVLLENCRNGPQAFAAALARPDDGERCVGAIVMNCNPFTLGHLALVEYAAAHCDVLRLFVVEEDRSQFSTQVRLMLTQAGTAHLPNVHVHLGGRYIISAATFPTYFLKEGEDAAALQAELDITLFAQSIAPPLHITRRFVGEEPLDPTTARYNRAMEEILPRYGITFCQIPRARHDGDPISASRVRALLEQRGPCPQVLELVPKTTADYLLRRYGGGSV